jgi:hypothetical protein
MFLAFSNITGLRVGSSTQRESFGGLPDVTTFDLEADPGLVYMNASGLLVPLPTQPSKGYRFDRDQSEWVDARTAQQLGDFIKKQRLELLQESDWTDTASAPARLGQEIYGKWQTYRQALRDITSQPGYPLEVVWPTAPQ